MDECCVYHRDPCICDGPLDHQRGLGTALNCPVHRVVNPSATEIVYKTPMFNQEYPCSPEEAFLSTGTNVGWMGSNG